MLGHVLRFLGLAPPNSPGIKTGGREAAWALFLFFAPLTLWIIIFSGEGAVYTGFLSAVWSLIIAAIVAAHGIKAKGLSNDRNNSQDRS